jgi:hypothetical protein
VFDNDDAVMVETLGTIGIVETIGTGNEVDGVSALALIIDGLTYDKGYDDKEFIPTIEVAILYIFC